MTIDETAHELATAWTSRATVQPASGRDPSFDISAACAVESLLRLERLKAVREAIGAAPHNPPSSF